MVNSVYAPRKRVDVLLLALGGYLSHRLTDRYIDSWKSPDFYKGVVFIYLIYPTGLVIRLVFEVVFIASSSLPLSTSITSASRT